VKTLLIYGAGAIGRGFIPWVFPQDKYQYFFIDTNKKLLNHINKGYVTFMCIPSDRGSAYIHREIHPIKTLPKNFDAVITAVGPRNCLSLADRFMRTEFPIIVCENDSRLVGELRTITGNPNIVFAIPDVITSNRGPERDSPSGVITEDGVCYIENKVDIGGNALYCDEQTMHEQWMAKLYIHNTAHCIAAYLGYQEACEHIHEAMEVDEIAKVVRGAMIECQLMCEKMYGINSQFLTNYYMKEIFRFSNPYLKDPISRVAREPLRKLAQGERLIGAATLCLQAGITPNYLIEGIKAAIKYDYELDPDYLVMKHARRMKPHEFLSFIGIPEREPIMEYMKNGG
jgi:hypothetical protein